MVKKIIDMAYVSIEKNSNEFIVVRPSNYMEHELVDARVFYTDRKTSKLSPTKKGFSINVELIPDLIDALEWVVFQPPSEDFDDTSVAVPSDERLNELADHITEILDAHGTKLHWDSIYKIVSDQDKTKRYSIRETRYCLVKKRDRFNSWGAGVFSVAKY